MGMELLRIALRVEETFGINIPDQVAPELTTPRKLMDFVMTQVEKSEPTVCLSQRAFHRLRRSFTEQLGLPRAAFRPAAGLEEMLPRRHRKETWQAIESGVALANWPALLPPNWLRSIINGIFAIVLLSGFILLLIASARFHLIWERVLLVLLAMFGAPLYAVAILQALTYFARPLGRQFPVPTVAALVKHLIAMNPSAFQSNAGWTRESVAAAIRRILIEETGLEDFDEDADFVRDLGID